MDHVERIHGVFGLMKEAIKLMRHNFPLFFSFVTTFTIPCSVSTVLLMSAIDVHHRYVIHDFISKGELVIFGWKFQTLISPLGLNFGFTILNLAPLAWLNTVACTRGVISIYRKEDLTTSIKNSFLNLHWAVFRLIATQSILYCSVLIILGISLLRGNPSVPASDVNVVSLLRSVFIGSLLVLLYHLPTPQVAILERRSYGIRGVYRAMELAYSKLLTSLGLAFFSVSYFCLLKLLVEVLLRDSYPFWTKFLAYPPLVISVITMSIFWQVVYTLLYLSTIQFDLDKLEPGTESSIEAADINHPLLADEVDRNEGNSSSQHAAV